MRSLLSAASSFVLILVTGCVGLPPKPVVEMCFPDVPADECICGLTSNPEKVVEAEPLGPAAAERVLADVVRKPISYCDKATSFPPAEWEKLINYIHALEDYGKQKCQ